MTTVAVLGMGLIGTSLAMALRAAEGERALLGDLTVVGYDQDPRATADARGRLAIDREARTLQDAVKGAHLVVLAVPVQATRDLLQQLVPHLAHEAVVTDVASTKAAVMQWAAELLPRNVDFIGGHPMAGKEQSGGRAADADLFTDAVYCMVTPPTARPQSAQLVDAMIRQVGGKPYYIEAEEHDAYVGAVSHLPFILSTALVEATSTSPAWKEMTMLAATGYRDISRLASGDVAMHRDIAMTNQAALLRWIDAATEQLIAIREMIARGDAAQTEAWFAHAREAREAWLASRPNMRPGEDAFESLSNVTVERPSLFFGKLGRPRPPRQQ